MAAITMFSTTFEKALVTHMSGDETVSAAVQNLVFLRIALILVFHSFLMAWFLLSGLSERDSRRYQKYVRGILIRSGIVLLSAIAVVLIIGRFLTNSWPFFYLIMSLHIVWGVAVNFRKRSALVYENFTVNTVRLSFFVAVLLILLFLSLMRRDNYLLEPYISSVAAVPHRQNTIRYDDGSGVYTITLSDDRDFRILHLTDIHLGGSITSFYKDYMALEACRRLIEYTEPDFIVVTGDMVFPVGIMSLSLNNEAPVRLFCSFMRNIGIPWAFTYGNHDTESMATGSREEIGELYRSLSYRKSGTLLYPYTQPEISGRSNQMILVENNDGSVREALFLIDSNDYIPVGINVYDYILEDQVEWYASSLDALTERYGRIVPSMLFFHIPLQEYRTAYNLIMDGSSEAVWYFGEVGETMINAICCSDFPSSLFDTALLKGSTNAMFCGHDHYNNISMEYKGMRLTYGMSIDYLAMPGISKSTKQRGGECITVHSDGSFSIEQIRLTDIQ